MPKKTFSKSGLDLSSHVQVMCKSVMIWTKFPLAQFSELQLCIPASCSTEAVSLLSSVQNGRKLELMPNKEKLKMQKLFFRTTNDVERITTIDAFLQCKLIFRIIAKVKVFFSGQIYVFGKDNLWFGDETRKNCHKFSHQFMIWKLLLLVSSCTSAAVGSFFNIHQRSGLGRKTKAEALK
jgi:hypothetical protein